MNDLNKDGITIAEAYRAREPRLNGRAEHGAS